MRVGGLSLEKLTVTQGFAINYYADRQRRHYSGELNKVAQQIVRSRNADAALQDQVQAIQTDFRLFLNAKEGSDREKKRTTLSMALTDLRQSLPPDVPPDEDLIRTLVDYSTGFQVNVFAKGRYFNSQGLYTAQGVSAGQIVPLKRIGLGRAAVMPSVLAQSVQFHGRNSRVPSGADGQYGFALVLQDQANGFDSDNKPVIHPWRAKLGFDYYSKVFGGALATGAAHDVFLRYRFVGPNPVEITPYVGWAGPGHKQYTGINVSVTFPVSF